MKTANATIRCENGLHMRVAADVVRLVREHDATVQVSCDGCKHANACSVLELLTLAAGKGQQVIITAEGQDENLVTEQLAHMFEQGDGI